MARSLALRIGSDGACIASNWAPPGVGRMAVQIECMGGVLAARARRRLGGGAIERQVDDAAAGGEDDTLMRYFLRRGLGPLAMAPLPVSAPEPAGASPGEAAPRFPKRTSTGIVAASPPAVRLAPVAGRADEEDLATRRPGADDEANGQHGRAAREVGRRAAGMRCCSAITAA